MTASGVQAQGSPGGRERQPNPPLREAITLVAGIAAAFGLAFAVLAWSVDSLVTWIPAEMELRVFANRADGLAGAAAAAQDERGETARRVLERLTRMHPTRRFGSRS